MDCTFRANDLGEETRETMNDQGLWILINSKTAFCCFAAKRELI